jgi:aryl-alcohol dehydrogenase-like predicted oxidoreductase
MLYSKLGKSALEISRIGLGGMSLSTGAPENEEIVARAIDLGINYFDTADLYDMGENEALLGKLLKPHRDRVVLATKVGNQWRADGSGWDWNPGKAYILEAVEKSLKRLQTDYIDLYQLHGGMIDDNIDETIEAFEVLKKQGKIREYGISSIRPNVIKAYVEKSAIVSVMMQYSLLDRRPEEACFDLLSAQGISVVTRGSLAQGLLVDKPAKPYLGWRETEISKAARAIAEVTGTHENPAHTAIRFALQPDVVASAVVGIRTLAQLQDIAGASIQGPLSEAQLVRLTDAAPAKHYTEHR